MLLLKLTKWNSLCIYCIIFYILPAINKPKSQLKNNIKYHTKYHKSLWILNPQNSTSTWNKSCNKSSHRHRPRHRHRYRHRVGNDDDPPTNEWIVNLWILTKTIVIEHCKLSIETRSSLMRWYKLYRPSSMCYWCV